jgi:hypothetical protein
MQTEEVALTELQPAAFNPPQRTADEAITSLLESIRQHGIKVPLAITENGIIIDGHRRYACAVKLGLSTVPVVRHQASTPEEITALWWELCRSTRKLPPAEVLWFHTHGGKVDGVIGDHIARLEAIIGVEGLERMAEKRVSPGIYTEAAKVANYCGRKQDNDFKARLIWWLVEHKQRLAVRHVMELDGPAESIIDAINEDRPIKLTYA